MRSSKGDNGLAHAHTMYDLIEVGEIIMTIHEQVKTDIIIIYSTQINPVTKILLHL